MSLGFSRTGEVCLASDKDATSFFLVHFIQIMIECLWEPSSWRTFLFLNRRHIRVSSMGKETDFLYALLDVFLG
jgi:hypothetical protein